MAKEHHIEERRAYEVIAEQACGGPPLDLGAVLDHNKIDLILKPFNYVSGILIKDPVYTVIVVNENDPDVRRRFTIAHELGHLFLVHEGRRFAEPSDANPTQERAANRFAGALLMPEDWLITAWSDYKDNPEHRPEIIADLFRVSGGALNVRLKELGIPNKPGQTAY